jgi:rhodanese-related sulfurtransferase
VPDAFKPANVLFGQSLNVRIDNFSAWLSQEAQRTCSAEACRAKTSEWNPTRESWAFAGGRGRGAGWGRTEGRDSLTQAALGAIYACNHRSNGSTALCEVSGANGFDLSGLYSTAKAAHDSAKAQLRAAPALAERAFASEDFGRGNVPDSGALRTQKLIDLTPLTLTPGIRTLLTGDLVTLLKSEPQTYILDVSNDASEALPGAATLWFGGAALDDPKAEEALDQRFRKLLTLTAPDVNAPLVVYGPSRNNWLGVNAAMRAQRAGWNNVFWYRGGLEAWRTAGLPTAPLLLRAAVR